MKPRSFFGFRGLVGRLGSLAGLGALCLSASFVPGCGSGGPGARSSLDQARDDARSGDADAVGRWLLAELTAKGGTAAFAREARAKLDTKMFPAAMLPPGSPVPGLDARLAAALDDDLHGRGARAFDEWAEVLKAAAASPSERAPLVALVAMNGVAETSALVSRAHRDETLVALGALLGEPARSDKGGLGFRAAASLSRWVSHAEEAGKPKADREAIRRKRTGCVDAIRLAGPFEHAPGDDDESALEAERAGRWPTVFEGRPDALSRPRVVATEKSGCETTVAKPFLVGAGLFVAETFIDLPRAEDVAILPDDPTRVAVDDVVVHVRDKTAWGGPLLEGTVVRLAAGRHRIVWRATGFAASLELRRRDGSPLAYTASLDPTPPYGGPAPQPLGSLHPALLSTRLDPDKGVVDPVTTFLAARAALDAGAADVAAVALGSPLNDDAAVAAASAYPGPVLALAGAVALSDPLWTAALSRSRSRSLFERATELDPRLWSPPLAALELKGEGMEPKDKVKVLVALSEAHQERPDAAVELLETYKDLGWSLEYDKLLATLVKRFPDDLALLEKQLFVLDEHGPLAEADRVAERLAKMDPDEPTAAERWLARRDLPKAIAAFEAFLAAHPDRKGIKTRLEDLRAHHADVDEGTRRLAARIAKGDASPIEEADHRLAKGEKRALERALAAGVRQNGYRSTQVLAAIDLLTQAVDFAPYRLDARKVIAEHDATHKDKEKPGAAERILDYGVLWVRSDGTSAFLEQEIVRVHSREVIEALSKVKTRPGRALHLRVLKKDGRELEPQRVAGKPDLTFPDLDVGDVIETEVISPSAAPSASFVAPRWYFAEPRIGYARSEYLVITPKGRDVVVETRAGAPTPKVTTNGVFDLRRFRVDDAPPAPEEPDFAAPSDEVLPNVAVGWGVHLEEQVARAAAALKETTPVDPRVAAVAASIVAAVPKEKTAERARRIYRWVMRNVQKGSETDGRRTVVGKAGSHMAAFRVLSRAASVQTYVALAHDALSLPPPTSLSAGTGYHHALIMVDSDEGSLFLSFEGRYTPFGYVPAGARGEDAIVLRPGSPHVKVPKQVGDAATDGVRATGRLVLDASGDAHGTLTMTFTGMVGAGLREAIERLSQTELHTAVESKLLSSELPGVKLDKIDVLARDDHDAPLGLQMEIDVPSFARPVSAGTLVLFAPFQPRLAMYAKSSKRLTPLLLDIAERRELNLSIELPKGTKLLRGPIRGEKTFRSLKSKVDDKVNGSVLVLQRVVEILAERVEPAVYPSFQGFCRGADALALEETVLSP